MPGASGQARLPPMVACRREHPLADGKLTLLGAWQSVTGAMTLVEMGRRKLLFDCGVAQGRDAAAWTFPEEALEAEAVVLTHAHQDHVGSLPILFERGFSGPVYATPATLAVADIVLKDSMRLSGATEQDSAAFRRAFKERCRPLRYDTRLELDVGGDRSLAVTLREAGHILGSSSVEVESAASRLILSGDLGRPDTPILRDYNLLWSRERPVDLVVMESTYGDREHQHDQGAVRSELKRLILRALRDGGHILVPAFAIGRTQTLLYHLNALVEAGELPELPVALDTPLGLRVTETYKNARHLYDRAALARIADGDDPLDFEQLYAVTRARDSERLREVEQPMLIIAGSGMCTGGRIVGHLKELLPLQPTCVLFVGYQARGTPGRAIQDAARSSKTKSVRLDHEDIPVRAEVATLSGLSAHADRRELRRWLSAIPNVKRVALHHGEPDAQRGFVEWVEGEE